MPSKSFAELIKEGNFQHVYNPLEVTLPEGWWGPGPGTEVRGKFGLVAMRQTIYSENDVVLHLLRRNRRFKLATAYELVAFAGPGKGTRWDGKSKVMALGSKFGSAAVFLDYVSRAAGSGRRLMTEGPDESRLWKNDRAILYVKV